MYKVQESDNSLKQYSKLNLLPVDTIILVICSTFLWLLYLLEEQLFSYLVVISFYYNPQY